jgi:hypothetical protein
MKDNLDKITDIINNHILVSPEELNDLIKDNPQKKQIFTEITKVEEQIYKKLKQSLQTVFTDLSKVIEESIKIIEIKYSATKSRTVNPAPLIRKIFDMTLLLDRKLTTMSKTASTDKQLDMLVKSYKNLKIASTSEVTSTLSISNFLEKNKDIEYDVLPNIISMVQSLNKKIDLLCNACLILKNV